MNREMWIGVTNPQEFNTPSGKTKKIAGLARWFTNISVQKPTDQTVVWKKFIQDEYPAYDNYPGFECSGVADIPEDMTITAVIEKENLEGWKNFY